MKNLRLEAPPVRLFILGARAESSLPRDAWVQLSHLFPRSSFHLVFIGPESMANRDDEFPLPERVPHNPYGAIVERPWHSMKISTIVDYYHNIHKTGYFYPYDPYFDCFVLFHPGLGHPASSHEWAETIPMLLETKAPIIVTGYTQYDMERDIEWVNKTAAGEFDLLLKPGENMFRSLRWDMNDMDPQDVSCGNWGVWAFRGKRYVTESFINDIFLQEMLISLADMRRRGRIPSRKLRSSIQRSMSVDTCCPLYVDHLYIARPYISDNPQATAVNEQAKPPRTHLQAKRRTEEEYEATPPCPSPLHQLMSRPSNLSSFMPEVRTRSEESPETGRTPQTVTSRRCRHRC